MQIKMRKSLVTMNLGCKDLSIREKRIKKLQIPSMKIYLTTPNKMPTTLSEWRKIFENKLAKITISRSSSRS